MGRRLGGMSCSRCAKREAKCPKRRRVIGSSADGRRRALLLEQARRDGYCSEFLDRGNDDWT